MRQPPRHPLIIIPARMASTRLPGKPLADIHGEPMIVHVWRRAMECGIGPVIVACDTRDIVAAIEKAGGKAVLTNPDHPSGSDRIWEALNIFESRGEISNTQTGRIPLPSREGLGEGAIRSPIVEIEETPSPAYDAVINLQGDLPTLDPAAIQAAWDLLRNPDVDIGTLVVEIKTEEERRASQVVKAALDATPGEKQARALYFSRVAVPSGEGPLYHHIGIYAYRREALAQFVAAPPSPLEMREKLEQLRALSLGLRIDAGIIETVPLGVDTPEDLEKARKILDRKK